MPLVERIAVLAAIEGDRFGLLNTGFEPYRVVIKLAG